MCVCMCVYIYIYIYIRIDGNAWYVYMYGTFSDNAIHL